MYPKQGTKELGKGESGSVKRDTQNTLRDQSGSTPVLLPECLRANSCFLKNKQKQQKLLDQNSGAKRNEALFSDPGKWNAGITL